MFAWKMLVQQCLHKNKRRVNMKKNNDNKDSQSIFDGEIQKEEVKAKTKATSAEKVKEENKVDEVDSAPVVEKVRKDPKANQKPIENNKLGKIIGYSVLAIVAVAIILFALKGQGIYENTFVAFTIGDQKIMASEYNLYYSMSYNRALENAVSYGLDVTKQLDKQKIPGGDITWADYFKEDALANLRQDNAAYSEALKAGMGLTEEDRANIDAEIEGLRQEAYAYGLSLNAYLKQEFGTGVNEKVAKLYLEKRILGDRFLNMKSEDVVAGLDQSELDNYYTANKDAMDVVSYRKHTIIPVAVTDEDAENLTTEEIVAARQKNSDEAKAKADAFITKITTENSFNNLARSYAPADAMKPFAYPDYTLYAKVKLQDIYDEKESEWLFSSDRKSGDKEVIEIDGTYTVIYFVSREKNDCLESVDVRHILISGDVSPTEFANATDAQRAAAKKKADEVYAEWKAGEKTEESFEALSVKYSKDESVVENKGLIKGISDDSNYVPSFKNWCLYDMREVGETAIVESIYGYHIMYLAATEGEPYYIGMAKYTLLVEKMNAYIASITELNQVKSNWFGSLFTDKNKPYRTSY